MKPFPLSRAEFNDSLRSVHETAFQSRVLEHLRHLHPAAQEVVLKHGDGGKDIVVYNIGRVYACYAPIRMNDWKESEVIAKINGDLASAKASLGDALKEWVFVHNHPASALTNKLSAHLLKLRSENPSISYFEVWGFDQLWEQIANPTPKHRRAAYLRAVAAAFQSYQELALDNFEAADRASPNIWDIFVHPACSETYLRPEDIDDDSRRDQPLHPTFDLITRLAEPEYRRTVLLADPGMGKSTLIQSLIAHLAKELPIPNAPALDGMLPVPIILRDLVPMLPQDKPEQWTWQSLLDVLHTRYRRDDTSPLLLDAYQSDEHRAEFHRLLHHSDKVFFLVDGLDEIGDRKKRRHLVRVLQQGIRAANPKARWLITTRVIGYDDEPVDEAYWEPAELLILDTLGLAQRSISSEELRKLWRAYASRWEPFTSPNWKDRILFGVNNIRVTAPIIEGLHVHPSNVPDLLCGNGRIKIAQRLYLAPFDDARQDAFAHHWFKHRHSVDYSTELMREVRQHGHDGVRVIARVPNLLCMMNMLKRSGKPLPDGRHALYHEIVKAYNGGIDAVYFRSNPLNPQCSIEPGERRQLLALTGAYMQLVRTHFTLDKYEQHIAGGNILLKHLELSQQLVPAIETMQRRGKIKSARPAEELLDELLHHISNRSGLLVPRSVDDCGDKVFGFVHLSFLEFFAAEWLGQEFKRQRDRAANRDEGLTEAELDHEFPCSGPITHAGEQLQITKADFATLPVDPLWHEPIIFLVESGDRNLAPLLRWLFPLLEGTSLSWPSESETLKPLVPRDTARLATKIAQDRDLALPESKRRRWWNLLWTAQLRWHQAWTSNMRNAECRQPSWGDGSFAWMLLFSPIFRCESMDELVNAYQAVIASNLSAKPPPLSFMDCSFLAASDLEPIRRLDALQELRLDCCKGLTSLPDFTGLSDLRMLTLSGCTALTDLSVLSGSSAPTKLDYLDMSSCCEIRSLADLGGLVNLRSLNLAFCEKLEDVGVLGLPDALPNLRGIVFQGCWSLSKESKSNVRKWAKERRLKIQW